MNGRALAQTAVTLDAATVTQLTQPGSAACQYTYSAWGACQSNSTQTHSVVTSSPAICTGTPGPLAGLRLHPAAADRLHLHLLGMGRLPVERYADPDRSQFLPR